MELVIVEPEPEPEPEMAMGASAVSGSATVAPSSDAGGGSDGAAVTRAGTGRLGGRVMTPRLLPTAEAGLAWADEFESSDEEVGGAQVGEGVPAGSQRLRPARSSGRRGLTTAAGIQQPQVRGRDRATTRIPSTVSDPVRSQPRRKSCECTAAPSPLSNFTGGKSAAGQY